VKRIQALFADKGAKTPQEREALDVRLAAVSKEKTQCQDEKIRAARQRDASRREAADLEDRLSDKPASVEYRKRFAARNHVKEELRELEHASTEEKPDLAKLNAKSLDAVKAKKQELRKALAAWVRRSTRSSKIGSMGRPALRARARRRAPGDDGARRRADAEGRRELPRLPRGLAKAGQRPTYLAGSEAETAWMAKSGVSKDELRRMRPRADRILRALAVSETKKEAWEKATAAARERLAAAEKDLAAVAKEGLQDVDDASVEAELAVAAAEERLIVLDLDLEEARAAAEQARVDEDAAKTPEEKKAAFERTETATRERYRIEDDRIETMRQAEVGRRKQADVKARLSKDAKPIEYRKRLSSETRRARRVTLEAISKEESRTSPSSARGASTPCGRRRRSCGRGSPRSGGSSSRSSDALDRRPRFN